MRGWLNSGAVQRLLAGRVDHVVLVCGRRYDGKAVRRRGGERLVRLNWSGHRSLAELTLTLCHELAHFLARRISYHDGEWRQAFADLVSEAGQLGLLTAQEVQQGRDAALHGPTGAGLDWRTRVARRNRRNYARDRDALQRLLQAGLQIGAYVRFHYKGRRERARVTRINRRTVTALRPDGRASYRVPFPLVEEVVPPQEED